mgnify:FL=1
MEYDAIVAGAGFAGATAARKLAEKGKKVLVLEKRNHVGGNAYDYEDENGVIRHEYGPHIFHTNSDKAVEFLSEYTDWHPYVHRVLGYIHGKLVPIPFNLKSIELCFDEEKATHLKDALIRAYGLETKVPILELRKHPDPEVKELAEFIFENVFKYYTMKQWGYTAEEIDPAVTARVPVLVSYDDRYFQDSFQQMPKHGYTKIFTEMLNHPNIEVRLNVDANTLLKPDVEKQEIYFEGKKFEGLVIYTGILDSFFGYCLGELPYRSLYFDVKSEKGNYQPVATVNYPDSSEVHPFTRITEYKHFMENAPEDKTTIAIEYPSAYNQHAEKGNIPYYPIFTDESKQKYNAYKELADKIPNLLPLGRLAEYRYYNMDAIIEHAIDVVSEL